LLEKRISKKKSSGSGVSSVVQLWEKQTQLSREQLKCVDLLTNALSSKPLPKPFLNDAEGDNSASESVQQNSIQSSSSSAVLKSSTSSTPDSPLLVPPSPMKSPNVNNGGDSSDTNASEVFNQAPISASQIENMQQFYAWYAALESNESVQEQKHRDYVDRLKAYHRIVDKLCGNVDAALKVTLFRNQKTVNIYIFFVFDIYNLLYCLFF